MEWVLQDIGQKVDAPFRTFSKAGSWDTGSLPQGEIEGCSLARLTLGLCFAFAAVDALATHNLN